MGWSFLGRLVREGCSEGRRRFCKNLLQAEGIVNAETMSQDQAHGEPVWYVGGKARKLV